MADPLPVILPTLAIDPGRQEGALVLLAPDGRTVRRAVAYKWMSKRKRRPDAYRAQWVVGLGGADLHSEEVPTLRHVVLRFLDTHHIPTEEAPTYLLVCEGLFVPQRQKGEATAKHRGKVRDTLVLAESAGRLMAITECWAAGEVLRPKATVWRLSVLGISPRSRTSSKAAEALALTACRSPDFVVGLGALARNPHMAEAVCMAKYGRTHQRTAIQNARYPGQGRLR